MRAALDALVRGLAAAAGRPGLVALLWACNLSLAAALALPFAARLEEALEHRDAGAGMLYGFDHSWWAVWHERQTGMARDFGPELLGVGFAFRNLELLLGGELPARLFADRSEPAGVDGAILGLGALYWLLQVFLAGGVIASLRGRGWSARGLFHGAGFYCGRMLRVGLLGLLVVAGVFAVAAGPMAWAEERAREAVSERAAVTWLLGRQAALLLALLLVHMVAGYARVILVLEERSSAVLSWLTALGFCAAHPVRTLAHYAAVVALGILLLAGWAGVEAAWPVTGFRTQLVALLLAQALVAGRLGLRVALLGGQLALYRGARGGVPGPAERIG